MDNKIVGTKLPVTGTPELVLGRVVVLRATAVGIAVGIRVGVGVVADGEAE